MTNYNEATLPDTKRHGIEWEITFQGVQFRTLTSLTNSGQLPAGITYDTLQEHTYDELQTLLYL